jgi:hypothetical protein
MEELRVASEHNHIDADESALEHKLVHTAETEIEWAAPGIHSETRLH